MERTVHQAGRSFPVPVAKRQARTTGIQPLPPTKNRHLQSQARVIACVVLVLSLRGINVLVPRLNKAIMDALAADSPEFPYQVILLYSLVTLLQGGMGRQGGLINSLKNIMWIR